jgi:serpin B
MDQNGVVVPVSLATLLGMLYVGARGETRQDIFRTLTDTKLRDPPLLESKDDDDASTLNRMDCEDDYLWLPTGWDDDDDDYKEFASALSSLRSCKGLSEANKIYLVDSRYSTIYLDFQERLRDLFQASVEKLPLGRDSAYCETMINRWVDEQTSHRITRVMEKDTIGPETCLILVNAIIFDGLWTYPFEKSDDVTTFGTLDGRKVLTEFMVCNDYFKYAVTPEFEVVEIPYKTNEVSFVVFLPVIEFVLARQSITVENIEHMISELHLNDEIKVVLPKFEIESVQPLVEELRNAGIVDAFDVNFCDLSNITDREPLVVSDITQKATLKIDEKGTEAATASACLTVKWSIGTDKPQLFVADRPFFFAVWNKTTKIPLFFGQFCRPDQ